MILIKKVKKKNEFSEIYSVYQIFVILFEYIYMPQIKVGRVNLLIYRRVLFKKNAKVSSKSSIFPTAVICREKLAQQQLHTCIYANVYILYMFESMTDQHSRVIVQKPTRVVCNNMVVLLMVKEKLGI